MAGHRKRQPLARRRRHDDDGEEEGSIAGDLGADSSDDGSLSSGPDANDFASEASTDAGPHPPKPSSSVLPPEASRPAHCSAAEPQPESFPASADTVAMRNGLKADEGSTSMDQLHFETAEHHNDPDSQPKALPAASLPQPRFRQPNAPTNLPMQHNPAFVPNRGGFFLHDDRTRDLPTQPAAFRGRGRGHQPGMSRAGFVNHFPHRAEKQWAHDLHDSVNNRDPTPPFHPYTHMTKPTTGPKRSFSTTTVLGNVLVHVSFPDTPGETICKDMVKTHYTLLPEHRPPLRRDKPVRISIPDEHPRYIFPSTDRSFIFIPRALRPNQQGFRGGRGRGSLGGSRRTSIYGGSNYAPSVAMSRKSSIAASGPGSGIHTPTGPPSVPLNMASIARPIVRMPMTAPLAYAHFPIQQEPYPADNPAIIHSPSATLPMHQPQPTKSVSLADIESPTIKAPQQQSEQPFHHQVPQSAVFDAQSQAGAPASLTHIPEGAVYAQPFQPYPMMPPHNYYAAYPPPAMMAGPDAMAYSVHAQPFAPGLPPDERLPVPHESNGMVYYYTAPQQHLPNYPMPMMPPGSSFYYPPPQGPMFYQ